VSAGGSGTIDRIHVGLVQRVTVLSAVLCLTSALAAGVRDRPLGLGIALGGGAILGLLGLYRWLAQGLLRPATQPRYRVLFWLVWTLKWPVIGGLFYLAYRSGAASAVGMVIGVSVVPAAAVATVVWALVAQLWRRQPGTGGEA
jgi:hypothetical protein